MKYDVNEHIENAIKFGFSSAGPLNLEALVLMPEVRDMCSADRCHNYGKSWCCPPACGTLEEGAALVDEFFVFFGTDSAGADTAALLHLIINARSFLSYIFRKASVAARNTQRFINNIRN